MKGIFQLKTASDLLTKLRHDLDRMRAIPSMLMPHSISSSQHATCPSGCTRPTR